MVTSWEHKDCKQTHKRASPRAGGREHVDLEVKGTFSEILLFRLGNAFSKLKNNSSTL